MWVSTMLGCARAQTGSSTRATPVLFCSQDKNTRTTVTSNVNVAIRDRTFVVKKVWSNHCDWLIITSLPHLLITYYNLCMVDRALLCVTEMSRYTVGIPAYSICADANALLNECPCVIMYTSLINMSIVVSWYQDKVQKLNAVLLNNHQKPFILHQSTLVLLCGIDK